MQEPPVADQSSPAASKSSRSISGPAAAAGLLVCVFTLTGFVGGWFWMFELTSHFRVQYAVILLTLAIGFLATKRWLPGTIFLAFGILNTWLLLPYISFSEVHSATTGNSIELLSWNVNSQNERFDELAKLVDQEEPDVILLMEVSSSWGRFLEASLTNYPHQHIVARDDNFGIALLSRLSMENVQTLYLGEAGLPSIHARFSMGENRVSFLGTHPLPPAGSFRSVLRDDQLEEIAGWVTQQTNAVVVAGDLNTTPWSPVFQEFAEATELKNSAEGRGLHGSWPAFFTPMLIPIDHFLHSENITVSERQILSAKGSDHLPQLVEFEPRQ